MVEAGWSRVEAQGDLDALDASVPWARVDVVAMVLDSVSNQATFPEDVARSGAEPRNARVLLRVDDPRGSHLELGFIARDMLPNPLAADFIGLRGRVDMLKSSSAPPARRPCGTPARIPTWRRRRNGSTTSA